MKGAYGRGVSGARAAGQPASDAEHLLRICGNLV